MRSRRYWPATPVRPRQTRPPHGRCPATGNAARNRGHVTVTALVTRVVGHASLDDPGALAEVLKALHVVGADDAVSALAIRGANAGMFDLLLKVHPDEASSYWFGREPDGTPSQPWKWQSRLVTAHAGR